MTPALLGCDVCPFGNSYSGLSAYFKLSEAKMVEGDNNGERATAAGLFPKPNDRNSID